MAEETRWQVNASGWLNYPLDANAYMQQSYDAGAEQCKIQLKVDGRLMDYTISFVKMTQTTDFSGKARAIRPPYESPHAKGDKVEEMGENVPQKGGEIEGNSDISTARRIMKQWMDTTKETRGQSEETLLSWKEGVKGAIKECGQKGMLEDELRPLRDRLRKVHNAYLDLKGNIRVYIRTRPFIQREADLGAKECYKVAQDKMTILFEDNDGNKDKYMFDSVFAPGSQKEVFGEVEDLMQSTFDGYNTTIFAYGQTGSGKTHTMYGPKNDQGIVPRCMEQLFKLKAQYESTNTVTFSVSMLEVYLSKMTDILNDDVLKQKKINVRNTPSGEVIIENLSEVEVSSAAAMEKEVMRGFENRKTAETAMNTSSSRSHLLATIRLNLKNKTTGQEIKAKCTLVDLAGSERVKDSQVTGKQLEEAVEINKSLTALGDCFQAITTNSKNANLLFRNNLLTQLLADSLGGSAKTLMFACYSPADTNYGETIMTMKWAERAKKVVNKGDGSPTAGATPRKSGLASPRSGAGSPQAGTPRRPTRT